MAELCYMCRTNNLLSSLRSTPNPNLVFSSSFQCGSVSLIKLIKALHIVYKVMAYPLFFVCINDKVTLKVKPTMNMTETTSKDMSTMSGHGSCI